MKNLFRFLLVGLLISSASAQVGTVHYNGTSKDISEPSTGFNIPSASTLTIKSGGTLTAAAGSVVDFSASTLTLPSTSLTTTNTATVTNKTLSTGTAISVPVTYTAGVKQTFAPNGTTSGFNVGSTATDPGTPANGDLWYDSVNNTLDARINGATVNLGAGGGGTGANPTASAGLTAVNGVAATFLRSDGAPAISQSIVPTWSGVHTFTPQVVLTGGASLPGSATITGASGNVTVTPASNGALILPTNASAASLRVGALEVQGFTVDTMALGANLYYDGAAIRYRSTGFGAYVQSNSGDVTLRTAPTGSAGAAATVSVWVRLQNTGAFESYGTLGYGVGAGGTVTQATSRTTGVTLSKSSGAITLVSAAGSATAATFTVTNTVVAATDVVIVNQKSGTDLYQIFVTNVAAGSFKITFFTTGGTTTEQPVFTFVVIKGVTT